VVEALVLILGLGQVEEILFTEVLQVDMLLLLVSLFLGSEERLVVDELPELVEVAEL